MAERRTLLGRIRDKVSRPVIRLPQHQATDSNSMDSPSAARPYRPPPPSDLPSTPNSPATCVLPSDQTIPNSTISAETASEHHGTVNVVGRDQTNAYVNHFHININIPEENAAQLEADVRRDAVKPLLHPLFDKLSHVAKASYDAPTPAMRRACTENTRTAILETIMDWASDPTKANIYWMNGMAGTGKTTITYSLSLALERNNILTATFFFSRLVDECTKVERIFPTIAYNLARNYFPLASTILEVLKNDPDIANRSLNQQFTELLVKPTRVAAEKLAGKPIVVIVDALDECANQAELRTLLSILFQRSSQLSFKIFITSRPEQVVRVGFNRQNPDNYSKLILHDIDRNLVNADIKLYLTERLVEMVDGRSDFQESSDDWPPHDKVDILTRQANGLFIYAKTVCDYIGEHGGNISVNLNHAVVLRKDSIEPSSDTLDTSELDRLYRDILDRAIPSRPKARDNLRRILSAVANLRNPLSARGLGALLEIDPGVIKSSLGSLHSVISVPQSLDEPVSTFHASFPDCLAERTRSLHHFLPPSESHEMLAKSCLSLMNSSLKENICNLDGYPANETIANETISSHTPEGLSYACMHWASHLAGTSKEEIRDADEVYRLLDVFLRDHILHWMEYLSLLRQLRVAVESLRVIEGWVLNIYPEMSPAVMDARRFVVENFEVISGYCLETYHSALVWLPVQSIIRKHHAAQKPDLPKVIRGLRNAWGSCERIIICGSSVNSVAFSSDGNHIVSGSDDFTVRIWNAVTGESEGVFKGHLGGVTSVAFSSDGILVVSGSNDRTIRIWNAVTGEPEGVFEGHSREVRSVAISSDGNRVVSGSFDETVRIWNVATGELERVFEGHSGGVLSVAISTDGNRVVSGSFDETVQIWNAATGASEGALKGIFDGILEGHSNTVLSVAISSDGNRVVSGSDCLVVRIWNATTGEAEVIMNGHSNAVSSVAISSDSTHLASGSFDKTVRIWNAATGEPERVFEGHFNTVMSVAFSSDGSRVVSGSYDKTVRIWSAAMGESEGLLGGHSKSVRSVDISSDGSYAVSGSEDNTVRLWDLATGELMRIFEGHSGWVTSVAFSSDGTRVVSGSFDKTIRIWNVATGKSLVFEGHLDTVVSVAFSSGNHVVSRSHKTVHIRNTVTGELDYVLDGDSDRAVLLPDGSTIHRQSDGLFTISPPANDHRVFRSLPWCSLSDNHTWIRSDSTQGHSWIPERYRKFSCTCSYGLKWIFGFMSGDIVIVDLG